MTADVDVLARMVWDYHHLNHRVQKSDVILVMGSHDLRVAERGAQLFLERWAPLVVFSGGLGRLTRGLWDRPEADRFAEIAARMGVPREAMLIENLSTNTSENVRFTRDLLAKLRLDPQRFILVHKPYMERRAFATFRKVWPEKQALATSPQISFEDYPNQEISKRDVIGIMVGDLQRIRLYSAKGYQIPQEIPPDVWAAGQELIQLGFNQSVIKE
ncbi:MAG: YdcF family protein [Terriglobia bacterium]